MRRRRKPSAWASIPHRELWLWLGLLFLTLFASLFAIAVSYFEKEPGYSLFGTRGYRSPSFGS
jgi:energy-coupling factor transporter transmembrane protein EcfT